METLSDFGSVSFFGISTLTTGIYNAWISFDDLALANQLSFYLLIFILGLFVLENLSRKKAQYHSPTRGGFKKKSLTTLHGYKALLSFFFLLFNFFYKFFISCFTNALLDNYFPKTFNRFRSN